MRNVTVSLDDESRRRLESLGGGSLSVGIRRAGAGIPEVSGDAK
ncbi:MAG: hypothetical protein ACRET1_09205 [Burkholderiales bacterium]